VVVAVAAVSGQRVVAWRLTAVGGVTDFLRMAHAGLGDAGCGNAAGTLSATADDALERADSHCDGDSLVPTTDRRMRAVSNLQKLFWAGGLVAGVLLIVAGALWIWQGVDGRNEVQATISREQIVGTPDMNPEEIRAGIAESGVEIDDIPTCDVADEPITTGDEARCFAEYMRVHALEGTGGKTFSQMGRFLDAEGNEAFSEEDAAKDPKTGAPVSNPARELWVTQRALATGLELSFVGERVSLFAVATGALFVVVGIGLLVMLLVGGVLGNPFERRAPG
jgi:hypothetical protein